MDDLTPKAIVAELDKYIVGQADAKRAVAVALRNRYRRRLLPEAVRRDIIPKNILMIGPTGVGKTEIARRVALLLDAPFLKVEATKFTEVGYVGRDVDSIIFDLVDTTINAVQEQKMKDVQPKAESLAVDRLVGYLCEQRPDELSSLGVVAQQPPAAQNRALAAGGKGGAVEQVQAEGGSRRAARARRAQRVEARPISPQLREEVSDLLSKAQLEDAMVEIELTLDPEGFDPMFDYGSGMVGDDFGAGAGDYGPVYSPAPRRRRRRVSVKEARRLLTRDEANKLIDFDEVIEIALERVEESSVVFIDEMDKIAGPKVELGADVSGEGVQRDLLPIIEGSTVMTRYGPVKSDHILFIGAGSFYHSKPSDLIPELQGRFPLRVELASLSQADFERILAEPDNALTKQYRLLLETEHVDLIFAEDGVRAMAAAAFTINQRTENIGARRLHTVVERVLEDVSFNAPDLAGQQVVVDAAYVSDRLSAFVKDEDLSRYIL